MSSIGMESPFFESDAVILNPAELRGRTSETAPPTVPWSMWRIGAVIMFIAGVVLALMPFTITVESTNPVGLTATDEIACSAALTESFTAANTDQILAPASGRLHNANVCFSPARVRLGIGLAIVAAAFAFAGAGRLYSQDRDNQGPIYL